MRSKRLPFRAAISIVLGWSQRITPSVLVPASSSETVKPAVRAKFPPLVTGTTTGSRVSLLNDAFDTMSTGRFPLCSWPAIGSSETSQISPLSIYRISLPTAGASIHSWSSSLVSAWGSDKPNARQLPDRGWYRINVSVRTPHPGSACAASRRCARRREGINSPLRRAARAPPPQ